MEIEIRHLRMVHAVGEVGSLTKAASVLGLTQPALTHQLQRLERILGGPLFQRGRHGARPTALGDLVIARARVLLPSMDELVRDARRHGDEHVGAPRLIRVASHPTPLPGSIVQRLNECVPDAVVSLRQHRSGEDVMELLAAGRLEVAVLVEHPNMPLSRPVNVVVHEIVTEPMFIAASVDHPAVRRGEVSMSELADERWILPEELEIRCAEYLRVVCGQAGYTPKIAYRLGSSVIRDVIRRGLGIVFVQATFVPEAHIAVRPLASSPTQLRHIVVVRTESLAEPFTGEIVQAAVNAYWARAALSTVYQRWLGASRPRENA
ncbi:MAG: LysR family transcriptional regulator [Actinomycetota bacterium]|nr:LysR family transcriptional regulator [Actinomycetota bacterium]